MQVKIGVREVTLALVVLATTGVVIYVMDAFKAGNERAAAMPPSLTMTASELCGRFDANQVAAGLETKGKRLRISGVVAGISDAYGGPSVAIECPGLLPVKAYFADSQRPKLAQTPRGASIAADCVGGGYIMGPVLHECRIANQ